MSGYGQHYRPPLDLFKKRPDDNKDRKYKRSYTWQEIWLLSISSPTEETFESILADPGVSDSRAMTWIVAAFASSGLSVVLQSMLGVNAFLGPGGTTSDIMNLSSGLTSAVIVIPLAVVLGIIGSYTTVGILHLFASILGGKGSFSDMYYVYASFTSPLYVIATIALIIPVLGVLVNLIISIYLIILNITALKTVYQYGWFQAVLTLFLPIIIFFGLLFCCSGSQVGATGAASIISRPLTLISPF